MIIYNYDPVTRYYTDKQEIPDGSTIPQYATITELPSNYNPELNYAQWNIIFWSIRPFVEEIPPPPPPATDDQINGEVARRLTLGFTFNGVFYLSDPASMALINDYAFYAYVAIAKGAWPGDLRWCDDQIDFKFISIDNVVVPLDAQGMLALGQASAAFRQRIISKGSELKLMSNRPSDYYDDSHW